jgi:integration host factor subunit alpha|tara:strand:- start:785 stop:1057 length:273 start_codon:yes stop_codon:yes gene_type:complete
LSVTKKQLSVQISNKLGLSQKDSLFFVSEFFGFLTKNYEKSINIQRFGTFLERKTPERVGRNPKTKEEFIIKERKKISFMPSSDLKQNIN